MSHSLVPVGASIHMFSETRSATRKIAAVIRARTPLGSCSAILAEISAAEHASNPSVQPAVKEAIEHAAELGSNPVSSRAAPSAPSAPPAPKAAASAAAASAAVPLAEAAERRPAEAAPSWYESLIKE